MLAVSAANYSTFNRAAGFLPGVPLGCCLGLGIRITLEPRPTGGANQRKGPGPHEGLGSSRMSPTPDAATRSHAELDHPSSALRPASAIRMRATLIFR